MTAPFGSTLYVADSIESALEALQASKGPTELVAGATWVMRSDLRGYVTKTHYIAIADISDLKTIEVRAHELVVGSCATHSQLAGATASIPGLDALVLAASKSANPSIRNVATIGGNLCARGFPASDLATALLGLNADIELRWPERAERISVESFLRDRERDCAKGILTRIIVPLQGKFSGHARLPLRKAGDYPVSIVSVNIAIATAGLIEGATIAVGSVEALPRRWQALEETLLGTPCDADAAYEAAKLHLSDFTGRDGLEAPGWYRVSVLPSLVRKAVAQCQSMWRGDAHGNSPDR